MIELKNINLSFGEKKIFKEFSLTIKSGEKIFMNSPSGKGKSTLLKIIMGFQKVQSGEVFVDKIPLNEDSVGSIRNKIGYIPQVLNFSNKKTIDIIKDIFSYKSNSSKKLNMKKCEEYFSTLDLSLDLLNKEFSKLSGGERQRIALVIALLMDREILFLDETINSLDYHLKEKVVEIIGNLNKTVIMISHDKVENPNFSVVRIND